jgi:hypothetical protein
MSGLEIAASIAGAVGLYIFFVALFLATRSS